MANRCAGKDVRMWQQQIMLKQWRKNWDATAKLTSCWVEVNTAANLTDLEDFGFEVWNFKGEQK